MTESVGFVLVHGYLGGPGDLEPLAATLGQDDGHDAVRAVRLPAHGAGPAPPFDTDRFVETVAAAASEHVQEGRRLAFVGHSTGGSVVLETLARHRLAPALVVLAATPRSVDASYYPRWRAGTPGVEPPLEDVAALVRLVSRVGRRPTGEHPLLVLHGTEDELVPHGAAEAWLGEGARGIVRAVLVPGGTHRVFDGPKGPLAVDLVRRWAADILLPRSPDLEESVRSLANVEPTIGSFLALSPTSARHLALAPSGRRAEGRPPEFPPRVPWEPPFANIEVTTRCPLSCPACARTLYGVGSGEMSREAFRHVLHLLPHAYRLTIVGLGEPLLHPEIDGLVADGVARGRHMSLVTSAAVLDRDLARRLIRAGLHGITFSLDAGDPELAAAVRPGVRLERIVENIRTFLEEARSHGERDPSLPPPMTAVFAAVSQRTAGRLGRLVDLVAGFGIGAIMLSDLNFQENVEQTVWRRGTEASRNAVREAILTTFRHGGVALSVRALEEFGLPVGFRKGALLPPESLWQRSERHTHCASPWQTVPVSVDGTASVCDCLPRNVLGNLFESPFSGIWNGEVMTGHRRRMRSAEPPAACVICPRF
jgi:MoaA/NifB/PqqE/SkfB family radical SAM enzyme/pimeloyl-ACP methyl ester carboxylesterase